MHSNILSKDKMSFHQMVKGMNAFQMMAKSDAIFRNVSNHKKSKTH
jgi:hypothetical protein